MHLDYRQQLLRTDVKPWQKAELCTALGRKGVLWSDLHPNAFRRLNLPHGRDYGVDVVDPACLAFASQVKYYGSNSTITWPSGPSMRSRKAVSSLKLRWGASWF